MESSPQETGPLQTQSKQLQEQTDHQNNQTILQRLASAKTLLITAIALWLFTAIYITGYFIISYLLSSSEIPDYQNVFDNTCFNKFGYSLAKGDPYTICLQTSIHNYETLINNLQKSVSTSLSVLFIGLFVIYLFYFLLLPLFIYPLYEKIVQSIRLKLSIAVGAFALSVLAFFINSTSTNSNAQHYPNFAFLVTGFLFAALALGVPFATEIPISRKKSELLSKKQVRIATILSITCIVTLLVMIVSSILGTICFILGTLSISLVFYEQSMTEPIAVKEGIKEAEKQDEELLSLQQAIKDNPQSYEAWANLGYRQHQLDKNEDALTSANKALALNKKYAHAWMVRGAALSTIDGQEDKALEALERALIEEPNNVDALYYKGIVFVFQKNDNAALALFDRVLALNPRHKEALISKGSTYVVTEDYDEALAVARELIKLDQEDAVGWRIQGMAYSFQGEKKGIELEKAYDLLNKALASFNKALEIDPHDSYTYLLKAEPLVVMGDNSKALEALNQGLKINPNDRQLQEAREEIVRRRTKKIASKVAGKAGRLALGVGIGLIEGHAHVAKTILDDVRKP